MKNNNDNSTNKKDFDKGVNMIMIAFNQQKEQYLNIINSLKEKIIFLEEQIKKLKEVNILYKNKLNSVQKNIKNISFSICQIKDDDKSNKNDKEENIPNKNKQHIKDNNGKEKKNRRQNLNKSELKKILYNNDEINKIFTERKHINADDDIEINNIKKQRLIKNNMLKNLYHTKSKNKKKSIISISNSLKNNDINNNNNNICFENKSERLYKNNLYDINGNYL